MATVNVTAEGTIAKPGTGTATGGTVRFVLSGSDVDTANGDVLPATYTEAAVVSGSGWATVQLWPNSRGARATTYRVYHTGETAAGAFDVLLGRISVPEAGAPHNLADLLAAGAPTVNAVYMGIITQAQYDAAIAVTSVTLLTKTVDHTLVADDERKTIGFDSASDLTLTVPADATHDFAVGAQFSVLRLGTGLVSVAGAGGVTVNGTYGLDLVKQFSAGALFKRAANDWIFLN